MNKRSRITKGFSHRLIAVLLCCVCLLAATPVYAIASEADPAPAVEETVAETPAEPETPETPEVPEPAASEETGESAAPAEETSDELFARLMAYETLDELNAALNALTEEEQALLDQFTDEQNAALEAKTQALGGYDADVQVNYTGTLTITDTIATDGRLTVSGTNLVGKTVTYAWEKSTDNKTWTGVTRARVTGDRYNMADDGSWINVALDEGARCYYRARIATIDGVAVDSSTISKSTQVTYYAALQNGSFETPAISNFEQKPSDTTAGIVWKTTATDHQIEIVNSAKEGTKSFAWHGVDKAYEGDQCAEINGNQDSALYQDVLTTPGATMHWQLAHLGRSMNDSPIENMNQEYTDTMYVLIMPYDSAQGITTQAGVLNVVKNPNNYPGAQVTTITYTWKWTKSGSTYKMQHKDVNGNWVDTFTYSGSGDQNLKVTRNANPWNVHSGDYTVPDNQYLTRYFFVAGETAKNDKTIGNHIDNVWFSTELPPANPGSANLTIQKTIDVPGWKDMSEEQQQKFKDAVSFTYETTTVLGKNMTWSGNVGTYQTNINLDDAPSKDITVTENLTDVDGYNWTGTAADKTKTVTLPDGGLATAAFTNKYELANKTLTIKKTVSGNMYDENATFQFTVSYGEGTSQTFCLGNGGEEKISIPVGAEVTITENARDYTYSLVSITPENLEHTELTNGVSFTMPGSDVEVVINNEKNIIVDTGIMLDTLPYVLILAAVGFGGAALVKKRRCRGED